MERDLICAERAVKLKLKNTRQKIAHVGHIRCDVILRAGIEVGLAPLYRRRDSLILQPQIPPRLVVIRGRDVA